MSKIVKQTTCRDCDYLNKFSIFMIELKADYICHCVRPLRAIRNPDKTPNWCPLEEENKS